MMEDQPDWVDQAWQLLDPARKRNGKGQPLPIGIQGPAKIEPVFDAVARHPNLVAAMTAVLGGETLMFYAVAYQLTKEAIETRTCLI